MASIPNPIDTPIVENVSVNMDSGQFESEKENMGDAMQVDTDVAHEDNTNASAATGDAVSNTDSASTVSGTTPAHYLARN